MKHEISFDIDDGSILIRGLDCQLQRHTPWMFVKEALSEFYRSEIDHRNDYKWIRFGGFTFNSLPCGLSLCFHRELYVSANFGVSLPGEEVVDGWPSKEAMDAQIIFMRTALGAVFSRSFYTGVEEFSWGTVWSQFDQKGFSPNSGLKYR